MSAGSLFTRNRVGVVCCSSASKYRSPPVTGPGVDRLKALLFSDLHLDAVFASSGSVEAARRRRQALRDTLVKIVDLAQEEQVDLLLCGGDLYEHSRSSPDTAAFLLAQFERIHPVRVFIAPGNHDWFGPESIYDRNPWSPNVHPFSSQSLTPVTLSDGLTLWGAAHTKPAGTTSFLDGFSVDRGGVHLALFHGSEMSGLGDQGEGKQPHSPFETAQIKECGIHHALLGHYHRPKDHERFTYPGNPSPLGFGEDGDRGAVIVEILDNGIVERRRINVASSEVHDIGVDLSGVTNSQEIRERVADAIEALSGSVRIKLRGEIPLDVDFRGSDLQDVGAALDTFAVVADDLHRALDADEVENEATVRGAFVRLVRGAGLASEDEEAVIVTGLRALQGQGELEVT